MKHSRFILVILLSAVSLTLLGQKKSEEFNVVETGIPEIQAAMKAHKLTSRELVVQYLTRIATYEDKLNAVITLNPNVLKEAEELDRERAQGKIRGPLHGIPIALKDNIHT